MDSSGQKRVNYRPSCVMRRSKTALNYYLFTRCINKLFYIYDDIVRPFVPKH